VEKSSSSSEEELEEDNRSKDSRKGRGRHAGSPPPHRPVTRGVAASPQLAGPVTTGAAG